MNKTQKALHYYKAGAMQLGKGPWPKPPFVPKVVWIWTTVRGEGPFNHLIARPGRYPVESNKYGAVSALLPTGEKIGLRLNEFEPLEWVENPAYLE